jgi:hypothetical protein
MQIPAWKSSYQLLNNYTPMTLIPKPNWDNASQPAGKSSCPYNRRNTSKIISSNVIIEDTQTSIPKLNWGNAKQQLAFTNNKAIYLQLYCSTHITVPIHAGPCMEIMMSIYMMHCKITTPQMILILKPNWVTTCRKVILPIYPT